MSQFAVNVLAVAVSLMVLVHVLPGWAGAIAVAANVVGAGLALKDMIR